MMFSRGPNLSFFGLGPWAIIIHGIVLILLYYFLQSDGEKARLLGNTNTLKRASSSAGWADLLKSSRARNARNINH